jgi:SAM-dependent methyltransferase
MGVEHGEGPGVITADGCAVEVYRRMPADGTPEIIHAAVAPGASILDLGAGVGRITDPLAGLAHQVTAVDNAPAMLAVVRRARTVCSDIAELRLVERYDVVLLASHLVNTPDDHDRHQLLLSAARHLARHGRVFVEWHPPEWFERLGQGECYDGAIGEEVATALVVHRIDGDLVTATVTYEADGQRWQHHFSTRRLSHARFHDDLLAAGLRFSCPLKGSTSWIEAVCAGA